MRSLSRSLSRGWFSTIRTKLAAMTMFLIAGISLFIYLYFPSKLEGQAIGAIAAKAKSIIEMTAFSVSPAVYFEDLQNVENALQGAKQNQDLVYIVVLDDSGQIVASFNEDKARQADFIQTEGNSNEIGNLTVYKTTTPIVLDGREIGRLYLGLSLNDLRAEVHGSRTTIALVSFMIFVIGMIAVFGISTVVTRPLSHIVRAVNRISKGDLTQRAAVFTRDEVGHLASSFNLMVDNLESTHVQLEKANKSLEKRAGELQQEINVRKWAEEAQRRSEEKWRSLVTNAPNIIMIADREGTIQFLNRTVPDLTVEKTIGKKIYSYVTPEHRDTVRETLGEVFRTGEANRYEIRGIGPHGCESWYETQVGPVLCGDEVVSVTLITTDITERKRAEERQVQLVEELESANRELKDLVYVASHDLKAPLRAIGSLATWISTDYADKLDDEGKEQISLLIGRVKRMHGLIDAILEYSRVGRMREEMVEVDLSELVAEVIDMIAPPENMEIKVEDRLPSLLCERTRFQQVFQNLLSNAIKYMDKPKGEIRIGCVEDGDCWRFSVADNGPGIERKHFEKIFQIFQTLSPRDESESTGVGLTIVKKIVQTCGGKIWVESETGRGSTFFFTVLKQGMELSTQKMSEDRHETQEIDSYRQE